MDFDGDRTQFAVIKSGIEAHWDKSYLCGEKGVALISWGFQIRSF